jgi:hypothetical protein
VLSEKLSRTTVDNAIDVSLCVDVRSVVRRENRDGDPGVVPERVGLLE